MRRAADVMMTVVVAVVLGLGAACGHEESTDATPGDVPREASGDARIDGSTEWSQADLESLGPELEVQERRALEAAQAMGGRLLGELEAALDESGPVGAISVCHERAPVIAQETGEEHGVRIGRTSFKLRNPTNTPPSWAEPYVREEVDRKVLMTSSDGALGVLIPIRLKEPCVMCHGPEDFIAEEVHAVIEEHYPNDRATGFEPGELRGWFWVEVPTQEL